MNPAIPDLSRVTQGNVSSAGELAAMRLILVADDRRLEMIDQDKKL